MQEKFNICLCFKACSKLGLQGMSSSSKGAYKKPTATLLMNGKSIPLRLGPRQGWLQTPFPLNIAPGIPDLCCPIR